jgi:pyruvate formate lyase activating enzyme
MVNITLPVVKIQRFSLHDGAGVRTTVFLKGCPLKCKWCHNPETQSVSEQFFYTPSLCILCGACVNVCKTGAHKIVDDIKTFDRTKCDECMDCANVCDAGAIENCSKQMQIDEIIEIAKQDVAFYDKEGGITLSGGEPLFHGQKAIALIEKAKEQNLNVVIQTCGYFDGSLIQKFNGKVDTVLFDIKDTDEKRHVKNTGVGLKKIIDNLFAIDSIGIKTILRLIIVQGENDNKEHYDKVIELYNKLKNCKRVEIFAHHSLGESKYISLGLEYNGKQSWSPTIKKLKEIKNYFVKQKVKCKILD